METKRPDARFRDEFAVRLSEGRGEEIARTLTYGRRMAWTTIVRTILLDDIVQRLVKHVPVDEHEAEQGGKLPKIFKSANLG